MRRKILSIMELFFGIQLPALPLLNAPFYCSISTILGHLVQDRHRALGNSRFGFVSARREAEVKLGLGLDLEVELRSVQCFPTRNPRSAGRLRKRRVATQLSAVSAREPWWPEEASSLRRSMGSRFEP